MNLGPEAGQGAKKGSANILVRFFTVAIVIRVEFDRPPGSHGGAERLGDRSRPV